MAIEQGYAPSTYRDEIFRGNLRDTTVLARGKNPKFSVNRFDVLSSPEQQTEKIMVGNTEVDPSWLMFPEQEQQQEQVRQVGNKIYAVDLSDDMRNMRKLESIGKDPESYWDYFRDSIKYYTGETYAHVSNTLYSYNFTLDKKTNEVRLYLAPLQKTARESMVQAIEKGGPDWYVRRCKRELAGIIQLEGEIKKYGFERVFFEASPAPFDTTEEQREGTTFTTRSFGRLHELNIVDGKLTLDSLAISNYLSLSQQAKLHKMLAGKEVEADIYKVLGEFSTIDPKFDFKGISKPENILQMHRLIDKLDRETAPQDKVERPPHEVATQKKLEEGFAMMENWLKGIFSRMAKAVKNKTRDRAELWDIGQMMRDWEMKIRDLFEGKVDIKTEQAILARISVREFAENVSTDQYDVEKQRYMILSKNREYEAGLNSCGDGIGVGGLEENTFLPSPTQALIHAVPIFSGPVEMASLPGVVDYTKHPELDPNLCPHKCMEAGGKAHFHCKGDRGGCNHAIVVKSQESASRKCSKCGEGAIC